MYLKDLGHFIFKDRARSNDVKRYALTKMTF